MNRNNLIVCGCSFTKGHMLPSNKTWGGYVANKKNLNFTNIANGGMGNEWISQKVISYLLTNKERMNDSIVMIGWSDSSRLLGMFERETNGYNELVTITPQDFLDGDEGDQKRSHWKNDINTYHGYVKTNHKYIRKFYSSVAFCFYRTYYSIYTLKHFLETHNIPYLFFDAISKNKIISTTHLSDNERENRYEIEISTGVNGSTAKIEELFSEQLRPWILNKDIENEIFNVPNYISFDGKSMLEYMREYGHDKMSEGNPGHPNELAADMFSDMIIKEYDKLYN